MDVEEKIGYKFKDKKLLKIALSHTSYAYENKGQVSNERIEYLGDAVLELIASEYLYMNYKKLHEGELTKIRAYSVCEDALVRVAKKYGLNKYLLLGKGEELANGRNRPSLIADVVEALIGAIYLDGGVEEAKKFVLPNITVFMEEYIKQGNKDFKTQLQEKLQVNGDVKIEYRLIEERGPDHNREFIVEVYCDGKSLGKGIGKSKKDAEMEAAKEAMR